MYFIFGFIVAGVIAANCGESNEFDFDNGLVFIVAILWPAGLLYAIYWMTKKITKECLK